MAKIITPPELSEVVTLLLNAPHLLGELDELGRFNTFFEDIATTVTNYCGGQVGFVDTQEQEFITLSIRYDESMPCPKVNVFQLHDALGFEDEIISAELETDSDTELSQQRIAAHLAPVVSKAVYEEQNNIVTATKPEHYILLSKSDIAELNANKKAIGALPTERVAIRKLLMIAMNYLNHEDHLPDDLTIPAFLEAEEFEQFDFLSTDLNNKIKTGITTSKRPYWL
ncbi:hypothetical protein [Vibrio owensii]|uniref:hypothetical protein n=1 Tax=Vibrio owensii TaxID=696485 RepID=UPI0018F1B503|nr:hypothetical protein [Vibrio owensii]